MQIFEPHEIIPPAYLGREQAYIKHALLKGYLERLLYIIGWSAGILGLTEVVYVDCFSGPWQDESEDLSATSIGISLSMLNTVHATLKSHLKTVSFKAVYVEKDKKAFSRLKTFLENRSPSNVITHAIHGDFTEKIPDILHQCSKNSFAFFFIDPKGWTPIAPNILDGLLSRPNSEFLINFMYNHLNRVVSRPEAEQSMGEMFDKNINLEAIPKDPGQREQHVLALYRKTIIARASLSSHPAMSAYVTVLDPTIDRTKYHLIYLTRHPLGIIEFMKESEKMAPIQDMVRVAAKINKKSLDTATEDFFGVDSNQISASTTRSTSQIETYVLKLIGDGILPFTKNVSAKILSETNCFPGELQNVFKRLLDQGLIINLDAKNMSRRTKCFVDFEKKERLRRVENSSVVA